MVYLSRSLLILTALTPCDRRRCGHRRFCDCCRKACGQADSDWVIEWAVLNQTLRALDIRRVFVERISLFARDVY